MNHYFTSTGERVSKSTIDRRIREAKQRKINQMIEDYGYIFCEDCHQNDCVPVDCSHNISVDECQKTRRTELAWDISNIIMRCRICHKKYDKL